MKRITNTLISLVVLTILTAGFATAATITIRTDMWAPYTDEPGEKPGYMVEVAEAIFTANGDKIDYQLMPWTRCLEDVKKGTYVSFTAMSDGSTDWDSFAFDGRICESQSAITTQSGNELLTKTIRKYSPDWIDCCTA